MVAHELMFRKKVGLGIWRPNLDDKKALPWVVRFGIRGTLFTQGLEMYLVICKWGGLIDGEYFHYDNVNISTKTQ